ncbi:beta-adaptin [Monosporozyma unispora]|nr:beta-adaptin [Kazachstania unispora]
MPPLDKKIKKFLKNSIRVAPKISNKGELGELRTGLVSPYPQTRKDAIKKTIQQMTLGKDVSSLFPDVLKNIATVDVEQKKLVYLYVMNYAETHPELCILAVNTFVTDSQEPNPLIRCMAIRTMSMIRVDKILEYIDTPLRRTLQDDNPYVRKTAVICVAKLFQLNKDLCVELGVLEDLTKALDDTNPMVIANAIAAITEINSMDSTAIALDKLIQSHVSQFLLALNECTEWARITILAALAEYTARDSLEAKDIIDRVTAHLQHVNSAVVLATIKVILKNVTFLDPNQYSPDSKIMKKISSALVSLMSTPPEIQYVALKNIRIILEKYPEILSKELRIFYVKFNDPMYIKLEKIEILVRLVDMSNIKQCTLLLNELKEYSMEFEPEFVSRAIQALAELGIKNGNEMFISKIVDIINNELLERGLETVRDDCCIAMNHDSTDMFYIKFMLTAFVTNFLQEESLTQIIILTSVIKLHSRLEGSVLQNIFETATTHDSVELDVRDMAMIYWRCFSMEGTNDQLINDLCNSSLPKVENILDKFSPETLEKLLTELGTISSIYFKPLDDDTVNASRKRRQIVNQNIIHGKQLNELQDIAKNELSGGHEDVLLDFGDDDSNFINNNSNSGSALNELDDLFSNMNQGVNDLNISQQTLSTTASSENTNKTSNATNTQDLLDLF